MKMLDWKAFIVLDLVFVVTLIYHEKATYTRPINVSGKCAYLVFSK